MLLKFSFPLVRPIARSRQYESRLAPVGERRGEVPQPHYCGLIHRADCGSWSFMAAILWWLLSSNSVDD